MEENRRLSSFESDPYNNQRRIDLQWLRTHFEHETTRHFRFFRAGLIIFLISFALEFLNAKFPSLIPDFLRQFNLMAVSSSPIVMILA